MKKKKRAGRPSKWETNVLPNLDRIPKLRRQGLTEEQIALMFGVAYSTFMEYKKQYPELNEALKNSKEMLIEDLEASLFRKALGLVTVKETKKYIRHTDKGQEVRVDETIKEIPPDTGALVWSLKNLDPERWRDNHDMDTMKHIETALQNFESLKDQLESIELDEGSLGDDVE